jgi:hypothetical protein
VHGIDLASHLPYLVGQFGALICASQSFARFTYPTERLRPDRIGPPSLRETRVSRSKTEQVDSSKERRSDKRLAAWQFFG